MIRLLCLLTIEPINFDFMYSVKGAITQSLWCYDSHPTRLSKTLIPFVFGFEFEACILRCPLDLHNTLLAVRP